MRWSLHTAAAHAAQLATAPGERLLWADVAAGSRAFADALERTTRLWGDMAAGAAPHALLLGAVAVALLCATVLVGRWALPAWEKRLVARWHDHPLAVSLPALLGVVVQGCLAWLAASLFLQLLVWTAAPIPGMRALARTCVVVITLVTLITAAGRGLLRLLAAQRPPWTGAGRLVPVPTALALALLLAALVDQHALLPPRDAALPASPIW